LLHGDSGDDRALAQSIEDNPICTVSYDPSTPCLLVRWKRHATSAQIRYIHECLIHLIKKHRVSKILGDDTDLVSIAAVDQHWIVQDWMPCAMAADLRNAASIKPRAYFGRTSVNRILSILPAGLAIRSFERFEDGQAWLRSAYQPGTYRILYRRFKGGDPINVFAFWCQNPNLGYFQELARVVIEGEDGDEVCRWSLEDEIRMLRNADRHK
jgi:hypothetical protein